MPTSVDVLRQTRGSLRGWIESVRRLPDPAAQPAEALAQISGYLKIAGEALNQASPSLVATQEWRDELGAYVETLREVRARLGNFEIMLRIRQTQAGEANNRLFAIRSWSDLAKNIG